MITNKRAWAEWMALFQWLGTLGLSPGEVYQAVRDYQAKRTAPPVRCPLTVDMFEKPG